MRILLLLIFCLAAAATANFFFFGSTTQSTGASPEITSEATPNLETELRTVQSKHLIGTRREVVHDLQNTPIVPATTIRFAGRTHCLTTGRPLSSKIEQLEGGVCFSDPSTGKFELASAGSYPAHVLVSSDGYSSGEFILEAAIAGVDVELEPALTAEVAVVDAEGSPIVGAEVVLPSLGGSGAVNTLGPRKLGITDESGSVRIKLGTELAVLARLEGFCSAPTIIRPGASTIIALSRVPATRIGLREDLESTPIAGATLRLTGLDSFPSLYLEGVTGDDGILNLYVPDGRYLIESPDNSVFFVSTLGGPGEPSSNYRDRSVQVRIGNETELIWIDASSSIARSIVLIDDQTRKRLNLGYCWTSTFLDGENPYWFTLSGPHLISATNGRIPLSRFALEKCDVAYQPTLFVSSRGYGVASVSNPQTSIAPGGTKEIRLNRSPERSITVTDNQGVPSRGVFVVTAVPSRIKLYEGRPSADGTIGPFWWNGEDVVLNDDGYSFHLASLSVSAEEFSSQERVTLVVGDLGEVAVQIPAGVVPRLVCIDKEGYRYAGTFQEDEVIFRSLQAGAYEVGPIDVVKTHSIRKVHGGAVFATGVRAGERTTVQWNPDWVPCDEVHGVVDVPGGDVADLFVTPIFEPFSIPIAGGTAHRKFRVEKDGRWACTSLDSQPVQFLVGRMTDAGLETFLGEALPNTTTSISVSNLRVYVPESFFGLSYSISYSPKMGGRALVGGVKQRGILDVFVDVNLIPTSVTELTVSVRGFPPVNLEVDLALSTENFLDASQFNAAIQRESQNE